MLFSSQFWCGMSLDGAVSGPVRNWPCQLFVRWSSIYIRRQPSWVQRTTRPYQVILHCHYSPLPRQTVDTSNSREAQTAVPGDAVTPLIVVGNSCKSAVYVGSIAIFFFFIFFFWLGSLLMWDVSLDLTYAKIHPRLPRECHGCLALKGYRLGVCIIVW